MWNKIIESFRNNPRDVMTIPLNNSKPRWFYVYVDDNNVIYFENARNHKPSCQLCSTRYIVESESDGMIELYNKHLLGESVRKKAGVITYSLCYLFAIFADLNL